MRQEFETWFAMCAGEPNTRKYCNGDGQYTTDAMQCAWMAWQAARATPALPQGEPVAYQSRMRASWSDLWTQWEYCSKGSFEDCKRVPINGDWHYEARALYEHSPKPQALPQGVEEWIEKRKLLAMNGSELNEVVKTSDLRAYLSGMAIVPVEPTEEMIDAAEQVDWSKADTKASIINMWQAMLAAAKEQSK